MWVPGVLDDGDDVGPLLGHVDEVTTRAMRELHRIHQTLLMRGRTEGGREGARKEGGRREGGRREGRNEGGENGGGGKRWDMNE